MKLKNILPCKIIEKTDIDSYHIIQLHAFKLGCKWAGCEKPFENGGSRGRYHFIDTDKDIRASEKNYYKNDKYYNEISQDEFLKIMK